MTSRIEIEVAAIGTGRVVVDGKDLSQLVRGFDLVARVGELTQLTLYAHNLDGPVGAEAVVLHEDSLRVQRVREQIELWKDAASDEHPLEGVALAIVRDVEEALNR